MGDSPQTNWPPFSEAHLDVEGSIDADIYAAAGELWPPAAALAESILHDEAAGQIALATVCVRITAARSKGRIQIKNLKAYIFRSYKHEILRQLQTQRLHDALIDDKYRSINETRPDVELHKKILLEQIVLRLDKRNRKVFELRVLGYTFEEIGKDLGEPSNRLRNALSKQLKKIKEELEGADD
jgi:RNA polymerase sigma factor (sigma-70 family)